MNDANRAARDARNHDSNGAPSQAPQKNAARDSTSGDESQGRLEKHASLLDQVHDPIIGWELGGRIERWNQAAAELYGYPASEALGRSIHELLKTRFPQSLGSILNALHSSGAWAGELVHVARDGRRIIVESRMRLVCDGALTAVIETNRDMTARRAAEEALRNSEAQYRASFELAAVGKAQIDPDTGQFLRVNQRLCAITGYNERELLGMTFAQITHPDDRQDSFSQWERVTRGDAKDYQTEKRYVRKDGEIAWVQVTGTVVRDQHGRPTIGIAVVHDITERKRDEAELAMHRQRLEELITKRTLELEHTHQRLRLSERMAALGTLSAGLGHDMGNLLLPLRLRLDSMEAKGIAPALREDLDAVRKCTEYLQRLANGLRLFALDPDAREAAGDGTDLNDWWADVYSFYKNALPRPVVLEARFAPDLPPVRMARPNLTQAIFNLVQNAGESLRGREDGAVVVSATREPDGDTIQLTVIDNGHGMSAEVLQRCLEPFFTTKTRGISTGLGLALVHGIVQKAGGTIQIDSEQGRGTTFILTVPAAQLRAAPSGRGHVIAGRPRALVTIKDARLRAYVASVLHSMSFEVSSSDGPDDEPAMLWLTDPNHQLADRARRFLAADHDRRIIVLGQARNGMEKLSGIVQFSEPPKPAVIRQTLRELAADFALLGLMESTLTAEEM